MLFRVAGSFEVLVVGCRIADVIKNLCTTHTHPTEFIRWWGLGRLLLIKRFGLVSDSP